MFFHVLIQMDNEVFNELIGDLSEQDVKDIVVEPYLASKSLYVNGRIVEPEEIFRLRIFETPGLLRLWEAQILDRNLRSRKRWVGSSGEITWRAAEEAHEVTRDFIQRPPSARVPKISESEAGPKLSSTADPRTIFLVHGRNSSLLGSVVEFLNSLGLHVLTWEEVLNQTDNANPFIHDVLELGMKSSFAVVVLFTPDDWVVLRPDLLGIGEDENVLRGQPRPNVIYEAGLAMSGYRSRTLLVEIGNNRGISDLSGMHILRLDNSIEQREAFLGRLRQRGCDVQESDDAWKRAGDFEVKLSPPPNLVN